MKKLNISIVAAAVALASVQTWAQTSKLATVSVVTGTVTVTDRVGTPANKPGTVGNTLAGLAYVAGNVPGAVDTSISFFTLTGSTLPPNPADTFTSYGTLLSPTGVGSYADVAALVSGTSYSGLTFAIDDLGLPIAGSFYTIHHKPTGDYFANIVPRTGGNSSTADLKPMSWAGGVAGGPSDPGLSGYFGLVYATGAVTGYAANSMYYLRTDSSSQTQFGVMIPALTSGSTDKLNLTTAVGSFGVGGYTTLAYAPVAFGGYAANQFYYLRLDSVTGYTVLGRLDPSLVAGARTISDIANLGGVFNTLNYAFDATGPSGVWGTSQLYATGSRTATAQSISFAAIADKIVGAPFTVTPSASSGLALTLTLVSSSTGSASITGPAAGVFTVKPLSPGVITLEAKQSGPGFDTNLLRQSFNATGAATLAITTQPTNQSAVTGTTATFTVVASGTAPLTYQWRKAGANIAGNASATTATLSLPAVAAIDAANYDVVVTNATADSLPSNTVTLTVTTATPVVTNASLTAAATVGTAFSYAITASNTPTSFTAAPLPAGLSIVAGTGVISGNPTTVGTTNVLLGATNAGGTGNATLVITVVAAGVVPIITNSPLTAAGTVGTAFSFAITASGTPTSYSAAPLPAGLSIVVGTGVISGNPTTVGTTNVLLGATNSTGTGNATLVITVAAAGVSPIITNSPLTAAGTVGTPISFTITATGTPTSYTAAPLPAGLSIVAATGVITGSPTTVGTTNVLLGATNTTGTGNATLVITVVAAGVAPVITNSPLTAAGTVGTPISFTITASGTPTSYTAAPLPAGLSIVAATGVITGSPTTVGTTNVLLGATNSTGTGNATLVVTVVAAGVAPIITNSPLTAAGTVGTPISFAITASGTPTAYSATPLPAGLSIVAATGVITGSPTTVGTTNVLLGATNTTGTGNATLVITVVAAGVAPVITNSPLTAAGTVGTPISFTITASGTPTSYTAAPLPAGLSIVAATGVITGSPTTVGTTNVLLGATNSTGTGNATLVVTVAAAGVAPIITNSPLTAAGTVGTPISFTITASGLPTSYTAAPLPAGLSIVAATGVITGTPTTVGTTNVLLGATNSTGTGNATLVVTVVAAGVAPVITNSPLTAAGTVGTPISFTITASGLPTSYSAAPLPAGLSIVAATGAITGTPTAVGTTNVLLGATNSTGTGNATLVVTVAAAGVVPIITNSPLTAAGTVGTPISFTITATGLPTSYTAAPLPAGLSIVAATGVITGTPTTVGTTNVLLGATNSTGTGNATLVVTVAAAGVAPIITNSPLTAAGTVGTPISFTITATGLPTSYTAAPLPAGLSIVAATGVITGTPTTVGTTNVVLGATNTTGTGNATLVVTVAAAGVAPVITNSPLTAAGTVGTPFSFTITATGTPTSYSASSLPSNGLTIVAATGVITGTPTASGVMIVPLGATNATGTGTATLTLTIASVIVSPGGPALPSAPIVTSPDTAAGTVGTPFVTYLITATGTPTSYATSELPAGLTLTPLTGAINGTPTEAGISVVTLFATNANGTGIDSLTFTIAPGGSAPIITSAASAVGTVGAPFVTYLIAATGTPSSFAVTGLPPGLSFSALNGAINGTPTTAGTTVATVSATNGSGTGSKAVTITIAPAAVAPIITSVTTSAGTVGLPFVTYRIIATGLPTSFSAVGLPAGLSLNTLTGAINGTPITAGSTTATLRATNAVGTGTATLTTNISPLPSSRLVNFSARALSGPGDQTLILGFVVAGDDKDLLVRGIGPGLVQFGVINELADPMLTLYGPGGVALASNDDWQTAVAGQASAALVAATAARVGAFALPAGSKDSALLAKFNNGAHTSTMLRPNSTTGVALTEIYDTDTTTGPRLVNVSARMNVSAGEGTLIAGFAIAGNIPKTVLIRGVGPTLAAFGVAGVMLDPQITVYSGSAQVASNDNWGAGASTVAQITTTSVRVGAFALTAGSRDAVLLLTLPPGTYTVQVTGVGNTTGVALVEIYDTQ